MLVKGHRRVRPFSRRERMRLRPGGRGAWLVHKENSSEFEQMAWRWRMDITGATDLAETIDRPQSAGAKEPALGIVVSYGSSEAFRPALSAFVWGRKVEKRPPIPYGRWRDVDR